LFEKVIKHILAPYNIGIDRNTKLEQYECPEKDTGQVVNKAVSRLFKDMNIESRHLGMERLEEIIEAYNKVSLERVGSTRVKNESNFKRDS